MSRATSVALLSLLLQACGESGPVLEDAAQAHLQSWFAQAREGRRDETLCHGLGLLKHDQFTCAEYLEHAAPITARVATAVRTRDCFVDVCGDFVEVEYSGRGADGDDFAETAVVKRDDGKLRLYWYRSTSLLALMRSADDEADTGKDPQQVAYDALVARYSALYNYPPCYQIRPTSNNILGDLIDPDRLDLEVVAARHKRCPDSFCIAFIGRKVATLCPATAAAQQPHGRLNLSSR
ncbi:MAG: hypothetical protein AAF513_11130 [Pseudomonadota bacterium]